MTIEYRELTTVPELDRTIDVQMAAWGRNDRSAIAVHMLQAVIHAGGMVIGALKDGEVIGYGLAIIGRKGTDKYYLWSHQTAVYPQYQRQKIGLGIKLAQREWALAHGYDTIGWTYDPLQQKNSRFNLHTLGTIGETFIPNFYGEALQDDLNRGMRTDRIEVMWYLDAPRVQALAQGDAPTPILPHYPEADFAVASDTHGVPHVLTPIPNGEYRFVEIPYDINQLKIDIKPLAMRWQEAVAEGLTSAFADGYSAVDCATHGNRCWIILRK